MHCKSRNLINQGNENYLVFKESGFDFIVADGVLDLKGLGSAGCVSSVEQEVGNLPGIEGVAVNFVTSGINYRYDSGQLELRKVIETRFGLGFNAILPKPHQSLWLEISGLHCAGCVNLVGNTLNGLEGFESAEVNVVLNRGVNFFLAYGPNQSAFGLSHKYSMQ